MELLGDLFVCNIPDDCSEKDLKSYFRNLKFFSRFTCNKPKGKNKNIAFLSVANHEEARRFLAQYGKNGPHKLYLRGSKLLIDAKRGSTSRRWEDDEYGDERLEEEIFLSDLEVGVWSYFEETATVVYFSSEWKHQCTTNVDSKMVLSESQRHIEFHIGCHIVRISFVEVYEILFCRPSEQLMEVYFSLSQPPEIFLNPQQEVKQHPFFDFFDFEEEVKDNIKEKDMDIVRVSGIDTDHERIAGTCFIYKCTFHVSQENQLSTIWKILAKHELTDISMPIYNIRTVNKGHYGVKLMLKMEEILKNLPIMVGYQIQIMISSGIMFPSEAVDSIFEMVILSSLDHYPPHHVAEALWEVNKQALVFLQHESIGTRPDFITLFSSALVKPPVILRPLEGNLILINHVCVTPTGYILYSSVPEHSNRVIRKFENHTSNFIRVSFTNENGNKMSYQYGISLKNIFNNRFGSILKDNGLSLAGRNYKFLAFSSSSIRDHGCWFFAPSEGITVENIRAWMGDFKEIRCPAKYAARMGQCFTSTVRAVTIKPEQLKKIPDIERNGYIFSDGIGTISPSLARKVWSAIKLKTDTTLRNTPSVFQIRFGGYKGVVSVNPQEKDDVLRLRESMKKFEAPNAFDLEIAKPVVKWQQGYLNRPFIMLLEHLSVPAEVFLRLQESAIKEVNDSKTSINQARKLVRRYCNDTFIADVLRNYWRSGLEIQEHPLLCDCMDTIRRYALKELQQRARIPVPDSFMIMGVLDETNTLKEGEVFICLRDKINNNDIDGPSPTNTRCCVLQGKVLVTRNPMMHPGDIQFFKAVDSKNLYHLQNCIVFSQAGNRPGPNMLAGGDLDGDEFFISMYPDFLFHSDKINEPPSYLKEKSIDLDRDVNINDVAEFFVGYMQTDDLGRISNMHLAIADTSELGPSDPKCLLLAELYSDAVDYPKTGKKPDMEKVRKEIGIVNEYPDYMNEGKVGGSRRGNRTTIVSQRALGKLWRSIKYEEDHTSDSQQRRGGYQHRKKKKEPVATYKTLSTTLWTNIKIIAVGWENYLDEARQFCNSFHSELQAILTTLSPSRWKPLSEAEALTACMVRDRHEHGRRLYDLQTKIRDAVTLLVANYQERLVPQLEEENVMLSQEEKDEENTNDVIVSKYENCKDFWGENGVKEDNDIDLWSKKKFEKRIGDLELARAAAWYYVGTIEAKNDRMSSFAWVASDIIFRILRSKNVKRS